MSFIRENFKPVGALSTDGTGGQVFSYLSGLDSLEDTLIDGYFNDVFKEVDIQDIVKITHPLSMSEARFTSANRNNVVLQLVPEQGFPIYSRLISLFDQDPVDTDPAVITFEEQLIIVGLGHSPSIDAGEITIQSDAVYNITCRVLAGKDSGGTALEFDIFFQVDIGAGFVDLPHSTAKATIKDSEVLQSLVLNLVAPLTVGDKFRIMQRVSSAATGLGIKNDPEIVGPPSVPGTPSASLIIIKVGS